MMGLKIYVSLNEKRKAKKAILIGLFLFLSVQLFAQNQKGLLATGTPAPAVITKLWQTNVMINYQPLAGIELKVVPATGDPFTVQIREVISMLQTSYYQPGSIVQVRYDPAALPIDPDKPTKKVVIESLGGTMNNKSDTDKQDTALTGIYMAELLKIDSLNQQIRTTGTSSKAVILTYNSYKNLNIQVNGNNPAVTLELEVIPEDRTSFKATTSCIILESSIPKYQPGKIIYVKYDPNDLTKVAVDHSSKTD